jgi:3-phenylpropionate/trans-cinnamate dioxygenase ferredoxin reductase subunit
MTPMVIVGAGECGARAALTLRESGWAGDIVLLGNEPGLPYERPPLSKPGADGVTRRTIADAERLHDAAIDFRPGRAVAAVKPAQRMLVLDDDLELPYDKLLLATGARPRALACPGAEAALTFRTHADATALHAKATNARHAVLAGAGLIGMELAATLRGAGLEVTVVESGPRALGRAVLPSLARRLVDRHRAQGVEILLGTGIECIAGRRLTLTDGSTREADIVLAAIGVVPETALAEAAGLAVDNGIVVDERLATSDPHIFAAGDCARAPSRFAPGPVRLESWRNAQDQGAHAARAMLGAAEPYDAVPWFWSDQYELGLQVAGLPDPARACVSRRVSPEAEILFQLGDDGRLLCASGLGPGTSVARDIRLAEMLIARGARPRAETLQDPSINLKTLLRS